MAAPTPQARQASEARESIWSNPAVRSVVIQVLVVAAFLAFALYIIHNTAYNLEKRGIASGFDFLWLPAGFDVGMSPFIKYDPATATHGTVLLVGILNTLTVAIVGNILATLVGFVIGVLRLSPNWLVSRLAYAYVETLRNIPLLLQLLFWYFAVLAAMPSVRSPVVLWESLYLTNRGLFGPMPVPEEGFNLIPLALLAGIVLAAWFRHWARKRQDETGQQYPVITVSALLILGLPVLTAFVSGMPVHLDFPKPTRFNIQGGFVIYPEFMALVLGLTLYTGAFIAEIVRAGIQSVSHGQTEAAYALGLTPPQTMRLIIIPQALRVIVPPLTSQYLNLTKNSSLAVAIGGAEIVAIFMGTSLNQTGQAIEIIAITMAFYMTVSLLISAFMNWYNRRIALVER